MVAIITRAGWGFDGPLGPAMTLPSRGVWIHHTVTTPTGDPEADMRRLEAIGISRFGRLSYSYAIYPSGTILEGQGGHVGAHTKGQNSTSHGVAAIGNYHSTQPPQVMVDAYADLIRHGAMEGWWQPVILGGHRDAPGASTTCPGDHLHSQIPTIRQAVQTIQDGGDTMQPPGWAVAATQWHIDNDIYTEATVGDVDESEEFHRQTVFRHREWLEVIAPAITNGTSGGLTQAAADGRYVRKGSKTITLS